LLFPNCKGKVVFNNYAISNVEIIIDIKVSYSLRYKWTFSIVAKPNDILVFVAKDMKQKDQPSPQNDY
jgi:hypothetical protein